MNELWSLVIYAILILLLVSAVMVLSYLLGERHHERATGEAYESGMVPTGTARQRIPVKYYLIALFFVIFDLESAFIYVWAISFRQTGWAGYLEVVVFIGILLATLVYLWRSGALDWGPKPGVHRNNPLTRPHPMGPEQAIKEEPES
jgi:NADH-quinone oxidoreductase subunit A